MWKQYTLCTVLAFMPVQNLLAQSETSELQQILPAHSDADSEFGRSISMSGDVLIAGVWKEDNELGEAAGSAYIFRWDGTEWREEQRLLVSDGYGAHLAGYAVAVDGEVAIFSAIADGDSQRGWGAGAVYVFRYDGEQWIEEQKIIAADGVSSDQFGTSVAIDGNRIVVGAVKDDSVGSAYVFRYDGFQWVQEQKLQAYDAEVDDYFGWKVDLSGDQIVVTSWTDDDLGESSGSAYVYQLDGDSWILHSKLLSPDGGWRDYFGHALAIDNDLLLISSNTGGANDNGVVYAYSWDGFAWIHHQTLVADDSERWDRFGESVALSGDIAVVGVMRDDDNGEESGSAYQYRFDGSEWVPERKLLASNGAPDDQFGNAVATNGNMVVVAAWYQDSGGENAGSAYAFGAGPVMRGDLANLYVIRGTWLRGDLEALEESDDQYVKVYAEPRRRKFVAETWTAVSCPTASPSSMEVTVEASSTKRHVETRIYLWNAVRGQWVLMTAFPQSRRDISVSLVGISSPAEYIYPGEGENLVFVRVKMMRSSSYGSFRMIQDHVDVTVFE